MAEQISRSAGGDQNAAAPISIISVVKLLIGLVFAWVCHPVWAPRPWHLDIDPSWQVVLHHAWAAGWQFGRDIVFTYGPYGFTSAYRYHPETFALSVVINLMLTTVTVMCLWRMLGQRSEKGPTWPAMAVLVGVVAASYGHPDAWHYVGILVPLLWVWLGRPDEPRRIDRVLDHLVMLQLALLALVKHTFVVAGGVVFVALLAERVLRRKQFPWFGVTALVGLATFWKLAGQSFSAAGDYLAYMWPIVSGFAEAMAVTGPGWQVLTYVMLSLVLLAGFGWLLFRQTGVWSIVPVGVLALILWLIGKAGFVRHDASHLFIVCGVVPALIGLLCTAAWLQLQPQIGRGLVLASFVAGLVLGSSLIGSSTLRYSVSQLPGNVKACASVLFNPGQQKEQLADRQAVLRDRVPLPEWTGSVDLLTSYQTLLLVHGLDYKPRPVIQSYSAYTPSLLRLNRERFVGEDPPMHVAFAPHSIDKRMISFDDSLLWPSLLTDYRVVGRSEPFFLLSRELHSRRWHQSFLAEGRVSLGKPLAVPQVPEGEAVWAEIQVQPSLWGRALGTAFRSPRLWIRLETVDGRSAIRRFVPGIGRAGFLLSPLLAEREDFARLSESSSGPFWINQAVTLVGIEVSDELTGAAAYAPTVTCRFFRCHWDRPSKSDRTGP